MRSRISRMSSAWRSLSLKAAMRSALGSSALRMILITLSTLSRTIRRPSSTWMRSSTWSSLMLRAARNRGEAELQPFAQDLAQVLAGGAPVQPDHHQIDRDVGLQAGLGQQQIDELRSRRPSRCGARTPAAPDAAGRSRRASCPAWTASAASRAAVRARADFLPALGCGLVIGVDLFQHLLGRRAGRQLVDDHLPLAAGQPLDAPSARAPAPSRGRWYRPPSAPHAA